MFSRMKKPYMHASYSVKVFLLHILALYRPTVDWLKMTTALSHV